MISRRMVLLSGPAIVGSAASVCAQAAGLTLGTASEGGSFPIWGAAFAAMMKVVDPTLELRLVATAGTSENVPRLEAGTLDLGLVSGEVAHEVMGGIGRPAGKLKVITAMYAVPGMFAVRADSRFRSIDDLKGQAIVLNGRDSGLAVQARYVIRGLGLDPDKDFEPVYTENLLEAPILVIERRAAALWGGGLRFPGFVKIAGSPGGARFVAPNAEEIVRIRTAYPFLSALTVPAQLYRAQVNPIETVGTWSLMLARADLPDAVGYRLAAGLHKGERAGQISKQLEQTRAKNTLAAIRSPDQLQPGVLRYYREAGLLR